MFASCKQFKAITASDHSTSSARPAKRSGGGVKFLEDISVTHGQTSTTKHTTKGSAARPNTRNQSTAPSGDIERADWLQLKYAVMLDANVEKLNNVSMLKTIDEWWGTRYCMGGSTKNCIDCSAFTQVVMQDVYGFNIPRTSTEQFNTTERIQLEDLNEGDLVFFNTTGRGISHVGIYLLNNKFVHAATSGGVMVSDLNDSYWRPRFRGAGRVKDSKDVAM